MGVRPHLPGHAHGADAVLRAVRPGHGAVDDRLVLPDVEVAPGALAGVVGAAAPPALGALHGPPPHVRHADVELVGGAAALLEPDVGHLPLGAEPHRPLEELRQHPGLRVHARLRSSRPPVDGIIPPAGSVVGRSNLCYPPEVSESRKIANLNASRRELTANGMGTHGDE